MRGVFLALDTEVSEWLEIGKRECCAISTEDFREAQCLFPWELWSFRKRSRSENQVMSWQMGIVLKSPFWATPTGGTGVGNGQLNVYLE